MIIENQYYGLYNLVCEGLTSRFDVTKRILQILGRQNEIKINKVTSKFFEKEYFADRPSSERLVNKRLNLRGINIMRNWEDALQDYIGDIII